MPKRQLRPEHMGDRVRRMRDGIGWSQAELASRAGVHRNTILAIEDGGGTTDETIKAIADAMDTDMDVLKHGNREPAQLPDPSEYGSPAERLLWEMGFRRAEEGLRRQSREMDDQTLITVAYNSALRREGFTPVEWRKLDVWRDWLLEHPTK